VELSELVRQALLWNAGGADFFFGSLQQSPKKKRRNPKRGYTVDLWGERGAVFPFKHDVFLKISLEKMYIICVAQKTMYCN